MGLKRTTKTSLVFLSFKNFKNFLSFKSFHSFQHTPKLQTELSKKIFVGDKRKIAALQQSSHSFVYVGWQYFVLTLDCCSGFLKIMVL